MNEDFLQKKLSERNEQGNLRQLRLPKEGMIDFSSNDYLGIVKSGLLKAGLNDLNAGSTGSRLLTGNYSLIEETEMLIAAFHSADSALIFNSGYDANLGLLSSVPQRGDTILYDYLSHASIRDGVRLSFAESFSFVHNDLNDLEEKLKKTKGNTFIVTESVFSMEGDMCPLIEMVELAEKYNAHLVIDEAHATGVIGEKGEGLVQHLALESKILARVHTFGKACGCHGAVVLGSARLKNYLINFARSFIYSTSLPEQAVAHIQKSYSLFPGMKEERQLLQNLISSFQLVGQSLPILKSDTAIQAIIIPGNEKAKAVAATLQDQLLDIRPILYPTIPKGQERLRIVLHAFNSQTEVELLVNTLKNSL